MGEIVNLRAARRRKGKLAAQQAAERNRIAYGRTKSERELARLETERAAARLDGHILTSGEPLAENDF